MTAAPKHGGPGHRRALVDLSAPGMKAVAMAMVTTGAVAALAALASGSAAPLLQGAAVAAGLHAVLTPPPMQTLASAWFLYDPQTGFDPAVLRFDPAPDQTSGPQMTAGCTGRIAADGTASGQCRVRDADGAGWDERFDCTAPLPSGPVPPAWAGLLPGPVQGCLGQVRWTEGQGRFAGHTAQGLFRLAVLGQLPDGRLIGVALRQYDGWAPPDDG